MMPLPVIAIFDIGKTNKKLFLFDTQYRIVFERSVHFEDMVDEDGDACENLEKVSLWVKDMLALVCNMQYEIKAINFATYGASFVYINDGGKPVAPLYNYLKAFPAALQQQFYAGYGGEVLFSSRTASPVLGSLNSGMQLYRLKKEQPQVFEQVQYALHLPNYFSFFLSGHACSDITSIGCHTNLWDFHMQQYHEWVAKENVAEKLAPLAACDSVVDTYVQGNSIKVGIGLHDSSAALIPYLLHFNEPFVLISTGTWCISLNPFNREPLTEAELRQDCLCYLTYDGRPVKAARVFAGYEHEQQVKRIAEHFGIDSAFYKSIAFDAATYDRMKQNQSPENATAQHQGMPKQSPFADRDLSEYETPLEAYYQLIFDLVQMQYMATALVLAGAPVKRIFVDGGFSKNAIYMNGLAALFSGIEVYAASMAQASALGAALVLHRHWNISPIPSNIIDLQYYHPPSAALSGL